SGLQASRLVVLHYRTDGTVETVSLKMNGDGTVTFTVDGFSTFVFAVEGTDNPDTDNPGTDNPGTDNPDSDNTGTSTPDTDNPGTDTPDSDNPGTDSSDSNNSGNARPDNPGNATGTGVGNTSNDAGRIKDDVPKTGDSLPAAIPITGAVCIASLAAAGILFRKRRKI
ncbi:LPXTG cell wall anchor domain-containing protein, partial [uncultured Acetatifactor sp.]|uniref:LPXTG cell wall anchor domain-containing protein n=1 Tax=uncultured Acetatifactor sp. TaxID=1671927 RepID=UPI0026186C77